MRRWFPDAEPAAAVLVVTARPRPRGSRRVEDDQRADPAPSAQLSALPQNRVADVPVKLGPADNGGHGREGASPSTAAPPVAL